MLCGLDAQVCRAAGVPLIINDRVDVALATGPDVGVHVGQDDIPAADVRRLLGPHRILGVSVKCVEQVRLVLGLTTGQKSDLKQQLRNPCCRC